MNKQDLLKDYNEKLETYMELVNYWEAEGFDTDEIKEVEEACKAKEAAWKEYDQATQ